MKRFFHSAKKKEAILAKLNKATLDILNEAIIVMLNEAILAMLKGATLTTLNEALLTTNASYLIHNSFLKPSFIIFFPLANYGILDDREDCCDCPSRITTKT